MTPHIVFIIFLFLLGACIGSFLNVVVWRLPRGISLVTPPSHCPKCQHPLAWYDNLPVIGWILLAGKCRYCKQPISIRYPIIEAVTGLLFVFYYVMFFMHGIGPRADVTDAAGQILASYRFTTLNEHWPIFGLYLFLLSGLLAASLIDAELFVIPIEIPWLIAGVAILVHTIWDRPQEPGTLNLSPSAAAAAAGGAVGLLLSIGLFRRGLLPASFPQGEPILEVDRQAIAMQIEELKRQGQPIPSLPPNYTASQIRREMRKEMLFLAPPLLLGTLCMLAYQHIPPVAHTWNHWTQYPWLTGLLGSLLGAMVGGLVVWLTRIFGTLGFGRVAMGLGDVHLMLAIGAVLGAGPAAVVFFLSPFFGLLIALYLLILHRRREVPYGPYLSLASAFVMLFYSPIADYLRPGFQGLVLFLHQWAAGS